MTVDYEENKKKFIELLNFTNRPNINTMITFLDRKRFFIMPASTRYHASFKGGLVYHSLSVLKVLRKLVALEEINMKEDTMIITALLHDICKAGAYLPNNNAWKWNITQPKGHAKLSLKWIDDCGISLDNNEREMIKFHMGNYYTHEFCTVPKVRYEGEYSLVEWINIQNLNKFTTLFYFADHFSTMFAEKE